MYVHNSMYVYVHMCIHAYVDTYTCIYIHIYRERDLFQIICLCICEADNSNICRVGLQAGDTQTGAEAAVLSQNFFFFRKPQFCF